MVETDQHPRPTGTRDGRQVTGGPALDTLTLVVLQVVVFCLLVMYDALKMSEKSKPRVSLCRSVGRSVCRSVCRSVSHLFLHPPPQVVLLP